MIVHTSGKSMAPLIGEGSEVLILPAPPGGVRRGDICALRSEDQTVLHRIIDIRIEENHFLFREKGDNAPFSSWVPENRISGKAVWAARDGEKLLLDGRSGMRRVAVLTGLSKLEASICDTVRNVKTRLFGGEVSIAGRIALRLWQMIVMPFKALAAPFLLSAYTVESAPTGEDTLLVQTFRAAARGDTNFPTSSGDRGKGLSEALRWHGLLPLMAAVSKGRDPSLVRASHRSAFTALAAASTAGDAETVLQQRGISYAVLKGPALSMEIYNSETERTSADVDILVRPSDMDEAMEAFKEAGYRDNAGSLGKAFLRFAHFHSVLRPPGKGRLPVELHWAVVDRANLYLIDHDALLSRAVPVGKGAVRPRRLAWEDELVYLCLHIAKHGIFNRYGLAGGHGAEWYCRPRRGNRLIWFLDLHFLLCREGPKLDWEKIRRRSIRWNVVEEVAESLRILDILMPGSGTEALKRIGALETGKTASGRRGFFNSLPEKLAGRGMDMKGFFLLRPARFLTLGRMFFPPVKTLARFYGVSALVAPLLYIPHPLVAAGRLAGLPFSPFRGGR